MDAMEAAILLMIGQVECVSKKIDDVYLNIFNMTTTTTTTNESKTLKKHNSCNCKCKFHGRKCISNQKRN